MNIAPLFEPFKCKSLDLRNRIVMAPMTRSFSPDGVLPREAAAYYARRAAADVGLIVGEATVINRPSSMNDPDVPHFHGEAPLSRWKETVDAVHAAGGMMVPQLWHVGSVRNVTLNWFPPVPSESPSGLSRPGKKFNEPMTDEQIADVIAAYADAAADAKRLGFDGVEIHGAHGYLIDQFFWDQLNERTDRFGGETIAERNTFGCEVVKAVREAVGEEFAVILRVSQFKQHDYEARLARNPGELENWLCPLAEAGVDILHCSQRRYWQPEFEGSSLNLAGWARKVTGRPTITVGSIGLDDPEGCADSRAVAEDLARRIAEGEFDLVAIGRALLSRPTWAQSLRQGHPEPLMPFDPGVLETLQ